MKRLVFLDANKNHREICRCEQPEVMANIIKFIDECNEKNKENGAKQFVSYYVRSWTENDGGKTWYDVGSHVEFFYTEDASDD